MHTLHKPFAGLLAIAVAAACCTLKCAAQPGGLDNPASNITFDYLDYYSGTIKQGRHTFTDIYAGITRGNLNTSFGGIGGATALSYHSKFNVRGTPAEVHINGYYHPLYAEFIRTITRDSSAFEITANGAQDTLFVAGRLMPEFAFEFPLLTVRGTNRKQGLHFGLEGVMRGNRSYDVRNPRPKTYRRSNGNKLKPQYNTRWMVVPSFGGRVNYADRMSLYPALNMVYLMKARYNLPKVKRPHERIKAGVPESRVMSAMGLTAQMRVPNLLDHVMNLGRTPATQTLESPGFYGGYMLQAWAFGGNQWIQSMRWGLQFTQSTYPRAYSNSEMRVVGRSITAKNLFKSYDVHQSTFQIKGTLWGDPMEVLGYYFPQTSLGFYNFGSLGLSASINIRQNMELPTDKVPEDVNPFLPQELTTWNLGFSYYPIRQRQGL